MNTIKREWNAPTSRQCMHVDPPKGHRRTGRQCRRKSRYHVYHVNGEGGGVFCRDHTVQRAGPGIKTRMLGWADFELNAPAVTEARRIVNDCKRSNGTFDENSLLHAVGEIIVELYRATERV